ncbi:hypothetical protein EXQ41_16255 [Clostridium botulinum]|nr:hypothetical protein [Clostridium botulinum]MBO0557432.1 hypothetical protein [Clostridium botulinum]
MNNYIDEIYKMLKSPIVTPYNLLENAKLNNYDYVKYYKGDKGLICEMDCLVDDIQTTFLYYFDENDFLQKILMTQNGDTKCVFKRDKELEKLKQEFKKNYSKKQLCI